MLLCELYNMQDAYNCKTNEDALKLFNKLREKIGNNHMVYSEQGYVSNRQCTVFMNAMELVGYRDYIQAIIETYDILHNCGNNKHELSKPEFIMLDTILKLVKQNEKRLNASPLTI